MSRLLDSWFDRWAPHRDVVVRIRVGGGKIGSGMDAARFLAFAGGADHQAGGDEHVLHCPAGRVIEDQWEYVSAPVVNLRRGVFESGRIAGDAHTPPHQ